MGVPISICVFSWNATKFYNAENLRSWQSADVLSLIDKTYQAMIEKQNGRLQQYLLLITTLLVLLIVAFGLYLSSDEETCGCIETIFGQANEQLNGLNEELRQDEQLSVIHQHRTFRVNQIKEEYIARFIKLCSTYINRLDAYRRMVNKKVSAGQIAELFKDNPFAGRS